MNTYIVPLMRLAVLAWMLGGWLSGDEAGAAPAAAPEAMVVCPQCQGAGEAKCEAPGCRKGKAPCSRTCLKKSDPWEHSKVEGQPELTVWCKIYTADKSTYKRFPQSAMGHLIECDNGGVPQDKGLCPDCKGTGIGTCVVCKGTAIAPCPLCKGAKQVAESVAKDFEAKREKLHAANAITLTDGTVLHGKIVMRTPTVVTIKTEDGKNVDVPVEKMPPEPKPEQPEPKKKD